jgi:hypothetical protein
MSDVNESKGAIGEVPENAQDLTIFVQNLLEQMVPNVLYDPSPSPPLPPILLNNGLNSNKGLIRCLPL